MPAQIDPLDRKILNILQEDATVSLKVVAERVHASVATCQRRIQALTERGVILKQVALVNPEAVGFPISVFVAVEMDRPNLAAQEAFERSMRRESEVMNCYEISGDYDFLLLIHARSMMDYHAFTRRVLNSDNNVRSFKSEFVMNFSKLETKILLDEH